MQAEAQPKAPRKPQAKSRVSNGKQVVTSADGRTVWVRRLRDLIEAHERDLGGPDNLTQAQRSIVRRAATISVELERQEAMFAMAGTISTADLDAYQRASNSLRRLLESLGMEPRQEANELRQAWKDMFQARVDSALHHHPEDKALCVGRDGLEPDEQKAFDKWSTEVKEANVL